MRVDAEEWRGSVREDNPFVPGQGHIPPYLAGRESEQSVLRGHLAKLAGRKSPGTSVVLYGPRGNGKTTLLLWAVRQARERRIRTVRLPASVAGAAEALRAELSLLTGWRGFLRRFRGVNVPWFGIRISDPEIGELTRLLERRARWGPLLVALDEAHKMDPELGREVLNAVQHVQGDDRPVMLLLAGTPDLPRHLNTMGASFWDRCRDLPIGRLGPADAADAVRIPLEDGGRSIEGDALDAVVRESHGYPFFLQLWGEAVWNACPDPRVPIGLAEIALVRPRFQSAQGRFYDKRCEELMRARLLPVAAALAELFAGTERRTTGEVEQAVCASLERLGRPAGEAEVGAACDHLRDLGYIWRVVHQLTPWYEPGIPSLMRFVERSVHAKSPAGQRQRDGG